MTDSQSGVSVAAERDVIISGRIIGRDYIEYRYSDKEELEHFMDQAILGYNNYAKQLRKSLQSSAPSTNPYLFLKSYGIHNHDIFFGRDQVSEELYQYVTSSPLVVLHARSGAGKSSLLNAGLGPRLVRERDVLPIFARTYIDPVSEIINQVTKHATTKVRPELLDKVPLYNALQMVADRMSEEKIVVILDQFEEIFTQTSPDICKAMVVSIGNCLKDETLPVHFVFGIRREYLGDLDDFPAYLPHVLHYTYSLRSMEADELKLAITGPMRKLNKGIEYQEPLVTELVRILNQAEMDLTTLQIICTQLYEAAEAKGSTTIDMDLYGGLGHYNEILTSYIDDTLETFATPTEQELAKEVLMALADSRGHRSLATQEEIGRNIPRGIEFTPDDIEKVIGRLVAKRLLHTTEEKQQYELVHDHLATIVFGWVENRPQRQAQDLVKNGLFAYRQLEILLDSSALAFIVPYQGEIDWTDEEIGFIGHSALMQEVEVYFWRKQLAKAKYASILVKCLQNSDRYGTSVNAYRALVLMGETVVEPLVALLDDRGLWDFTETASELIPTGSKKGRNSVVAAPANANSIKHDHRLTQNPDFAIVSALAWVGDHRALNTLILALNHWSDWTVPGSAAETLISIGGRRAVEGLLTALGSEDRNVRIGATWALGEIRDSRAVEGLVTVLGDEDRDVRLCAVEALGKMEDSQAVEGLLTALGSEDRNVRIGATWALGEIRDSQAVEGLVTVLDDEDRDVRLSAVEALGKIGDSQAVEGLQKALGDEDRDVRLSAVEALGKMGDSQAVESLVTVLDDEDRDVRRSAVEALGKIGDSQAVEGLQKALGDDDPDVRQHAERILNRVTATVVTTSGVDASRGAFITAEVHTLGGDFVGRDQVIIQYHDSSSFRRAAEREAKAENIRRLCVEALEDVGDSQVVERLIIEAFVDASQEVDETFREMAETTLEPFITMLNSEYSIVRYYAAKTLGEVRATHAIEPLEEASSKEKVLRIHWTMESALEMLKVQTGSKKVIRDRQ